MEKITLIIPAFNEKENVFPFFERCEEVEKENSAEFRYVFIDDGSRDGTFAEIQRLKAAHPSRSITGLSFSRNFGKEAAMFAGLKEVSTDYAVIIDADLQQDPSHVIEMYRILEESPEYDSVCCYQSKRHESFTSIVFKKLFYGSINRMSDTRFVENASDFRMLRKGVVDAILSLGEYYRFSKGIFSWVGFNTCYIPYEVNDRLHGKTTWTFRKLTRYAIDGFIGFSTSPLHLATVFGLITSVAALIYLIITVIQKLTVGIDAPGYATIVCLILLIGGIQMLLLGIIGEYIARTYIEVKHRPIYIIKERTE
ncbi:MAG: glycosyltransferase [Firmicutes bacterium]|nr:glycosyltransferase [Bacillota bacterium]MBR3053777.1 glycosyltransferase [Bacillota bacterium]